VVWAVGFVVTAACAFASQKPPDSIALSYGVDFVSVVSLIDGAECRLLLSRFEVRKAVVDYCRSDLETTSAVLLDGRKVALTQAVESDQARMVAVNFERWLGASVP
jgi:hypothetical protein